MQGFARVAAAVPRCRVADFETNRASTLSLWKKAHEEGCFAVFFPELGLCGYTARDLLYDQHLLSACERSLATLLEEGRALTPLAVVGLPLRAMGGVFNVAAAIQGGKVLGLVPKVYLPNYREFEETRWFRPGSEVPAGEEVFLLDQTVPFGTDILFRSDQVRDLVVGVEICEDFWVPVPPSGYQVSAGATVIGNISASNFTIGKAELRRLLGRSISDRGKCAYVYVAAGPGESSTDLAFDSDAFLCENGHEVACSQRFSREEQLVTTDIDLELLVRERMEMNSFGDCAREHRRSFRTVSFDTPTQVSGGLRRTISAHPFLPDDPETMAARCWETFEIQCNALVTRMEASSLRKLVLGVSGGLDSTQAALVAAVALDMIGSPRSDLLCVTMPGLGTTSTTRNHAENLAKALGASFREIAISQSSFDILEALGHPAATGVDDVAALIERVKNETDLADVTLENVQARLRTLILMCLANQGQGLLLGTGDLSEKALGWCTYAGDHIAMYDLNAGVPKTLIQFVIRWVANERVTQWTVGDPTLLRQTLFGILETPITPELVPSSAEDEISQLTESAIGPYELHDFFLFHFGRHGARPGRILDLARVAFEGRYEFEELTKWLKVFFRRFFTNQFKRSCATDGPKVGTLALSPRGDWRMPSDATVHSWIEEIDRYEP